MSKSKTWTAAGLKRRGYDGLCLPGACGCVLNDLRPCGQDDTSQCVPGYVGKDGMMYPSKKAARAAKKESKQ